MDTEAVPHSSRSALEHRAGSWHAAEHKQLTTLMKTMLFFFPFKLCYCCADLCILDLCSNLCSSVLVGRSAVTTGQSFLSCACLDAKEDKFDSTVMAKAFLFITELFLHCQVLALVT